MGELRSPLGAEDRQLGVAAPDARLAPEAVMASLFDAVVAFVGRGPSVDALAVELGIESPETVRVAAVLSVPVVLANLAVSAGTPVGASWLAARLSSIDGGMLGSYATPAGTGGDDGLGDGALAIVLGTGRPGVSRALAARAGMTPAAADRVLAATARSVMAVLAARIRPLTGGERLAATLAAGAGHLRDAGWGPWIEAAGDGSDTGEWTAVTPAEATESAELPGELPGRTGVTEPAGLAEPTVRFQPMGGRRPRPARAAVRLLLVAALGGTGYLAYRYAAVAGGQAEIVTATPSELLSGGTTVAAGPGPASPTTTASPSVPPDVANPGGPATGDDPELESPGRIEAGGSDGKVLPGRDGATVVIEAGTLRLTGDVPDQRTADELVASFSDIDLGSTVLVDELEVVDGAPPPGGRIVVAEAILFEFDSNHLIDPSSTVLGDLATIFNARPEWRMTVVGHTDSSGPPAYNLDLSLRRAAAVRDALVAAGVPAASLRIDGAGSTAPVASNQTLEGRAENRRIEIEVTVARPG